MSQPSDKQNDVNESKLTVDQVAQEAGIPTSTVRLYQNKGLLAPPERRGRVGYYGQPHRDRLQVIAQLQKRGFSLAAIKESLDSWNAGRSLNHLLGISPLAPRLQSQAIRLSPAEMAKRFQGVEITQSDMQKAVEIGLVEIDGTDFVISNEAFVGIGPAIAKMGVPVSEILDEYAALKQAVAEVAERFKGVFERNMWQPFLDKGEPSEQLSELSTNVSQLTALAVSVVTEELQDEFANFASEYLGGAPTGLPTNE